MCSTQRRALHNFLHELLYFALHIHRSFQPANGEMKHPTIFHTTAWKMQIHHREISILQWTATVFYCIMHFVLVKSYHVYAEKHFVKLKTCLRPFVWSGHTIQVFYAPSEEYQVGNHLLFSHTTGKFTIRLFPDKKCILLAWEHSRHFSDAAKKQYRAEPSTWVLFTPYFYSCGWRSSASWHLCSWLLRWLCSQHHRQCGSLSRPEAC